MILLIIPQPRLYILLIGHYYIAINFSSTYLSNSFLFIRGLVPFQIIKSSLPCSSINLRSFLSPMPKYADASSTDNVYFSHIGICSFLLLIQGFHSVTYNHSSGRHLFGNQYYIKYINTRTTSIDNTKQ